MNQFLKTIDEIKAWLDKMSIKGYRIIHDSELGYLVDVEQHVLIHSKKLPHIPVQFNRVGGNFYCLNNNLTSLWGCPKSVRGNFNCSYNLLTSLEGSPEHIDGYFDCSHNNLSSLQGTPKSVRLHFDCSFNSLTSLQFCPQHIEQNFCCRHNDLVSLDYFPQYVRGGVNLNNNQRLNHIQNIESFEELSQIHRQIVQIKSEQQMLEKSVPLKNLNSHMHKI